MKKTAIACALCALLSVPALAADRMVMAVMDFEARDIPKADALKISELIRNEMINSNEYVMIERAQLGKILKEQGFQMTGCVDVSCAVQVGKLLSARKILVGSVMRLGEKIVITGRIVDVEKGIDEFGQKATADSHEELVTAVEKFCEGLTARITGKAPKKKAAEKKKEEYTYRVYNYGSTYDAVSDPTPWLALGSGLAGGVVCLGGYLSYKTKAKFLNMQIDSSNFMLASSAGTWPELTLYSIIDMQNKKNDLRKLARTRDTVYYVGAGLGGFSALMLITFIGRYIHYTYMADAGAGPGSVALIVPPLSCGVDNRTGKAVMAFGLGLSMRM